LVSTVGKRVANILLKFLIFARCRSVTPKARLIPLSTPFIEYLRSDGIVLPSEESDHQSSLSDTDSGIFSSTSSDVGSDVEDEESEDPSLAWLDIHQRLKSIITELGGNVVPKLNWSAPKDATWISATNNMECYTPNDIYLLLKSSDFITHDLEQAFDGCEDDSNIESDFSVSPQDIDRRFDIVTPSPPKLGNPNIPFHLILRKTITALVTSLEFRCFVRGRQLLCMCQRDLNHYCFLSGMIPVLRPLIHGFFDANLKNIFPDDNFVFDVYIPPPHTKVWLIDINPWAPRTDPLLFSWLEILRMRIGDQTATSPNEGYTNGREKDEEGIDKGEAREEGLPLIPEFRLVNRDDPEAYSFNTSQYSAHKLPKDVVDAAGSGQAGLTEFMGQWRDTVKRQEEEEEESED